MLKIDALLLSLNRLRILRQLRLLLNTDNGQAMTEYSRTRGHGQRPHRRVQQHIQQLGKLRQLVQIRPATHSQLRRLHRLRRSRSTRKVNMKNVLVSIVCGMAGALIGCHPAPWSVRILAMALGGVAGLVAYAFVHRVTRPCPVAVPPPPIDEYALRMAIDPASFPMCLPCIQAIRDNPLSCRLDLECPRCEATANHLLMQERAAILLTGHAA
jgi:hypothetical protein